MSAQRNEQTPALGPTRQERIEGWLALGSLARLARFRARRAQGYGWPKSLVLGRWYWLKTRWRELTYLWLLLLATLLVLVPIPNPGFGPFKSGEEAEGFLRTLWQVEAAALALSLAIIVFAVQAYRSSTHERYGGTLRRYIRASFLQEGYELGVVSLLLTAAVLLGAGHGGPSGSAGAVAAATSLASVLVLPLLLTRALRTTHRDFLGKERENRLIAAVRDQVDREVEARLGLAALRARTKDKAIDLALVATSGREAATPITADVVGAVADIKLRRLMRLGSELVGPGRVTLRTRLYEYVGTGSDLLLIPNATSGKSKKLARRVVILKSGRRRDETLSQYLDDLKEEAVAAIRSGGPATYQGVADAYVETLLEFPRSWQRYGQEYNTAVAQGMEFFPTGPVDEIAQQFYSNTVEALRAGSDEVLLDAAYLPIRVCTQALQYRADGLLGRMIRLSGTFLASAWAHGGEKGKLLESATPRHLVEFTRFYLRPRLEEGELDERLRFGGYVRLIYSQIGAMLKLGVDEGRASFLRRLDGDWGTLLEHWDVEMYSPHPVLIPELEEAAQRGDDGAAASLAAARDNAKLVDLHQELDEYRTLLRFGLALWAWRQQPMSWEESFRYFSAQMGGLHRLTEITTQAASAEFRDRVPWSDWILGTLQEGRAHFIPGPEAVVETFIAAALRAINPTEATPVLPPAEWMAVYLDHALKILGDATADARNSELPDVGARVEKLKDALEDGARAWREQERLTTIEAPLVPEKVAEFCAQARAALVKARVVSDLLRLAGAVTALASPPDDPPMIQAQARKALFVEDSRMVGAEMVANDVGRQAAHLELRALIQPMTDAAVRQLVADDPSDENVSEFVRQLGELITRTRQNTDSAFVVLLVPLEWRLSQALGLSFFRGAEPPAEWGLSEGGAHHYAGIFEGAPVFRLPQVPRDLVYVANLSRYVNADVWEPDEDKAVAVTVLGESEARERAQHDPARDELGEDEIVRRWLETAIVTVDPGLRLRDERDKSALIAIRPPTSLMRNVG